MATIRKNQRSLTASEKQNFVNAVLKLKANGKYDDYVTIHHTIMMNDFGNSPDTVRNAHGCASFLPWHRQYLLLFEQDLQAIDPSVSLPYWDWTVDNSSTSSLWGSDFMGGDGTGTDSQVTTGPFAYSTGNWNITVGNGVPYLRRSLGRSVPFLPSSSNLNIAMNTTVYDAPPYTAAANTGFRNTLEGWTGAGLHNQVHPWVGGHMALTHSPNDPVFWLHHCFIDKIWAQWQASNPSAGYLPSSPSAGVISLNEAMRPWNTGTVVTPADVLDHTKWYKYDTE